LQKNPEQHFCHSGLVNELYKDSDNIGHGYIFSSFYSPHPSLSVIIYHLSQNIAFSSYIKLTYISYFTPVLMMKYLSTTYGTKKWLFNECKMAL